MRFCYADPPYLGCGALYATEHPDAAVWNDIETHRELIARLCRDYPDGWAMSLSSPSLRAILPLFPMESSYGIITDDHYPQTKYWWDIMEAAAGDRLIAVNNAPGSTASLSGQPCFGGGLVRAMGSLMPPPDVHHNSTDVVWREIGDRFNLITFVPEVTILERHPIHGSAPMDDTYKRGAFNPLWKDMDPINQHKWSQSPAHDAMIERISKFLTD